MNKLILAAVLFFASQISFAQSTNPAPYCDASFDDAQGFWVDDHINSVSFGGISNITNAQYAAPHYVFYNNLTVKNFIRGNNYTLSVNFTTAGGCGYGVWIDYNQNNVFEATEKIAGTTGTNMLAVGATPTITQNITIPNTATLGNTRMRVRIVEDDLYNMTTTSELPCNTSSSPANVMDWGETEDYIINITGSTSGAITSFNPISAPQGTTVTINGSGFTGATAVKFGGVNAQSFNVVSASQITAVVGSGATGEVSVVTPSGTITLAGFTFLIPATISSFSPDSAAQGITVTINGSNFTGATAVKFGGVNAQSFNVVSASQITAVVGSGATGEVSVVTPNGTATLAGFVFVTSTGLNELMSVNGVKTYPNPAANQINIDFATYASQQNGYTAKLTNILGQVMQVSEINAQQTTVDVSAVNNGVYILTIQDANGKLIATSKISIMK